MKIAYSLDVVWETEGGVKTYQLEEFKTENVIVKKEGENITLCGMYTPNMALRKDVFGTSTAPFITTPRWSIFDGEIRT